MPKWLEAVIVLILYQAALLTPQPYRKIDSSEWGNIPKLADPTPQPGSPRPRLTENDGWTNRINCQGVDLGGDHYAVEDTPTGARIVVWTDPANGENGVASVWEFKEPAPDPEFGGQINTRQRLTVYIGEPEYSRRAVTGIGYRLDIGEVLPWSEFVPPHEAITRHGYELSTAAYESHHELITGDATPVWRDWIDATPTTKA